MCYSTIPLYSTPYGETAEEGQQDLHEELAGGRPAHNNSQCMIPCCIQPKAVLTLIYLGTFCRGVATGTYVAFDLSEFSFAYLGPTCGGTTSVVANSEAMWQFDDGSAQTYSNGGAQKGSSEARGRFAGARTGTMRGY